MTNNALGHKLRFSDSSFYDEVCEHCGGTDSVSDDTLKYECAGTPERAEIERAWRDMSEKRRAFEEALNVYNGLIRNAYNRAVERFNKKNAGVA